MLSSTYSDTITLDTSAPTGSIVINGGDVYTSSTSASLSLTANDATSGVSQVRYSNGLSTQLEVSDARLLLQQAEVNEAQAMRDYLMSVAQLEQALGRPVKVEQRPLEQLRRTIRSEDPNP